MKKLVLALSFICMNIYASGKLTVSPNYYLKTKEILPQVGVSAYEPLFLGLFYDGYIGAGIAPSTNYPQTAWLTTRHDLGQDFDGLKISVGVTLTASTKERYTGEDESNVHIRMSYGLW